MSQATTLGSRMRQLRKQSGISQRDLAKRAGITAAYVCRLDSGVNPNVSAKVVFKLARGLGTAAGDLMMAAGYYDRDSKKEELPHIVTYLKLTTDLDAESIRQIAKFVEFMIAESKE